MVHGDRRSSTQVLGAAEEFSEELAELSSEEPLASSQGAPGASLDGISHGGDEKIYEARFYGILIRVMASGKPLLDFLQKLGNEKFYEVRLNWMPHESDEF